MNVDDLIMVSNDDHVIEPENMFENHVPAKWKDQAPKIVRDDGGEKWVFGDLETRSVGTNAVVTVPKEEWTMDPSLFAEMRPGAYDVHERVRDMDRNGILASICFPSFIGFANNYFNGCADKDLALVMTKAYNDWHIDEWAASYPGRFIPLAAPPVWDPHALADEIRRVAKKGCRAITMPELPHVMGHPSYLEVDYWDPFFRAASEEQVVMCMHIGGGLGAIKPSPGAPIDNMMIIATQISALAAQDLLWGPAFRTYPELKVAFSEGGIGWISFYLDRCDRHYLNQRWLGHDWGGKLPSDVFREHALACYVTDPTALKVRHDIGIDIIAWECDFPHADSIWPNAPEFALDELNNAGCTDEEIDKILWKNTCRHFGWDPFQHISRADATVGALRSRSPDVDTTVRSKAEWRELYTARA